MPGPIRVMSGGQSGVAQAALRAARRSAILTGGTATRLFSPLGRELPILVLNLGGKFLGWRPGHSDGVRETREATSAVYGAQESGAEVAGWMAEVFIPYELLSPLRNAPSRPGTRWRANFYRMAHDGGRATSWDWARKGLSFHEFARFGTQVFEGAP